MGHRPFLEIAEKLKRYRKLLPKNEVASRDALTEAGSLLRELDLLDQRIMSITHQLVAAHEDMDKHLLDKLRSLASSDSKLKRFLEKNPNLTMGNFSTAYMDPMLPGIEVFVDKDLAKYGQMKDLRLQIQTDVPAFYIYAHRLLKLFGHIRGLRKIKCNEVTMVRNKLIEHPHERDGRGGFWSFGYSKNEGALITPMRRGQAKPPYKDAGYFQNRKQLLKALKTGLDGAIKSMK